MQRLQGDANNCVGKTFNLGSNFEIGIAELIEIVALITGVDCEYKQTSNAFVPLTVKSSGFLLKLLPQERY